MTRIGMTLWAALAGAHALSADALAAEPSPADLDAALQQADQRFTAGDLAGALAILEPACSKSDRPECLFGLGAIQHGLGHCPEARRYYRRYREVAPTGEQIEEVSAALEEVEGRCGAAVSGAPPRAAASDEAGAGGPARNAVSSGEVPASAVAAPGAASAPPDPEAPLPAPVSMRPSITSHLMLGSFALSGATAVTSVVFGVLAAQSAHDCERARVYDEEFRVECEENGPRYQGLWQGFALASASFLSIGMTLWWIDSSSTATLGVSGAGTPVLNYRRQF